MLNPNCHLLGDNSRSRVRTSLACAGVTLLLLPVIYSAALDAGDRNDASGYRAGLARASADPYYAHQYASHLFGGSPVINIGDINPPAAIPFLRATLVANPDLEYAHYNLGWLLLESDPATSASHFLKSARLAPQRGAVYLGLGLARIRLNDTAGAVRAFATEWLLDPATAWSPAWNQPPLDALRVRIHTLARETALARNHGIDPWSELETSAPPGEPYRRVRTGYGVLMGHPDGAPPVDFPVLVRANLPADLRARIPTFGWIDGRTLLQFLNAPPP